MGKVERYEDLIAWQKSYQLVLEVYKVSRYFPKDEQYGLTSQIRRAAVSVPSNIAEGWGRGSRKEYIRFLEIARGSIYELDTQLRLATDLGYMQQQNLDVLNLTQEVSKILNGLVNSLR
ncbi:MAG TPA: four helix bundle protein [Phycisphaerales bacterium]|nr:four helix bundle protein [Phycisphaerales bacterium]HCD31530.1 four helix bundle protein [Phycisphaerales bacterium]|tara:strand:- start:188 stop:544 length:357 start_codon:yes stop_codon:yes gene_type:complete